MPNCKFCGKPVISARVMHAHCWEQKVMELMKTVCDNNRVTGSVFDTVKCTGWNNVSQNCSDDCHYENNDIRMWHFKAFFLFHCKLKSSSIISAKKQFPF